MLTLTTPLSAEELQGLQVGDRFELSGDIFCGRDAVLPKLVAMSESGTLAQNGIQLEGGVIFHTAVSVAGIGPTSSNKLEIEQSIVPLSKAGVRIHLGKGALHAETVAGLEKYGSIYAVIPPVTALLESKILRREVVAFPEQGMEAFYAVRMEPFPVIVAAAHGQSIFA